jgi:hypothetical protein
MIIIKRYPVNALGLAPVVKAYAQLTSTEATSTQITLPLLAKTLKKKNNMSTKGLIRCQKTNFLLGANFLP